MKKNVVFHDDFTTGLQVGTIADQHRWNYMEMGPVKLTRTAFETTTTATGLQVSPTGRQPQTNEPMFTTTAPGQGDHMKWSINVNQTDDFGQHGVAVRPGQTLNIEAEMSGQQFGTDEHPFGDAVPNSQDDLRLGVPLLMAFDPENMIVFDFALTNQKIYAIYERGKSAGDDTTKPAAYSFEIPLADRQPDDFHKLRLSYNPDSNTIAWYVDDALLYEVEGVGQLIDRQHMYIDNGGVPKPVISQRFNTGLGLLSLLDGAKNGGPALVNLTHAADYYDPQTGAPTPVQFVDHDGRTASKLFGQGVTLQAKNFSVYYTDNQKSN